MFNFMKTSAVAALIAAAPFAASAAIVVMEDFDDTMQSYAAVAGNTYLSSDIEGDGGAGMWRAKLIADSPVGGVASASILSGTLSAFEGLQMSWLAADGMQIGTTLAGPVAIEAAPLITTLATDFSDPNLAQFLKVEWTNSTAGVDFDIQVDIAAVPVPAAGLMLLTALGGAAAMRRRAKV